MAALKSQQTLDITDAKTFLFTLMTKELENQNPNVNNILETLENQTLRIIISLTTGYYQKLLDYLSSLKEDNIAPWKKLVVAAKSLPIEQNHFEKLINNQQLEILKFLDKEKRLPINIQRQAILTKLLTESQFFANPEKAGLKNTLLHDSLESKNMIAFRQIINSLSSKEETYALLRYKNSQGKDVINIAIEEKLEASIEYLCTLSKNNVFVLGEADWDHYIAIALHTDQIWFIKIIIEEKSHNLGTKFFMYNKDLKIKLSQWIEKEKTNTIHNINAQAISNLYFTIITINKKQALLGAIYYGLE